MAAQLYVNNSCYAIVVRENYENYVLRTYAFKGEFYIKTITITKQEFERKFRKASTAESFVFFRNINKNHSTNYFTT